MNATFYEALGLLASTTNPLAVCIQKYSLADDAHKSRSTANSNGGHLIGIREGHRLLPPESNNKMCHNIAGVISEQVFLNLASFPFRVLFFVPQCAFAFE